MQNLNRTIASAANDVAIAPCSSSFRLEQLEPRQLMSVTSPTPTDNNDYHFVLADPNGTTAVRTSNVSTVKRTPLPNGFTWFDGTPHQNLSAVPGSGFSTALVDGWDIWPLIDSTHVNKNGLNDETRTRAMARYAATYTSLVIIDIEEIALDLRGATPTQVTAGIARFQTVLGWIRSERPTLKVAMYGYLSLSDQGASTEFLRYATQAAAGGAWYKDALPASSDQFADWQASSAFLMPLAQMVDYVMPSIYTGSSDPQYWVQYAQSMITDSRRFGKPVIPFIWPQFHGSVPVIGLTFMDASYWQTELDTVRSLADGALVWLDTSATYNPSAAWVTESLLKASADYHLGAGGTSYGGDGGEDGDVQTDPIIDTMGAALAAISTDQGTSNNSGVGGLGNMLSASAGTPSDDVFAIDSYIA